MPIVKRLNTFVLQRGINSLSIPYVLKFKLSSRRVILLINLFMLSFIRNQCNKLFTKETMHSNYLIGSNFKIISMTKAIENLVIIDISQVKPSITQHPSSTLQTVKKLQLIGLAIFCLSFNFSISPAYRGTFCRKKGSKYFVTILLEMNVNSTLQFQNRTHCNVVQLKKN